jgi:hypothetical protein
MATFRPATGDRRAAMSLQDVGARFTPSDRGSLQLARRLDSAINGLRDLFDYALWHVAALLLVFAIVATILGVVGYRLAVGRSPRPA